MVAGKARPNGSMPLVSRGKKRVGRSPGGARFDLDRVGPAFYPGGQREDHVSASHLHERHRVAPNFPVWGGFFPPVCTFYDVDMPRGSRSCPRE